jgi:hypothetical protein
MRIFAVLAVARAVAPIGAGFGGVPRGAVIDLASEAA